MTGLTICVLFFTLVASVHMFHTQLDEGQVQRVCTPRVRSICRRHVPQLTCRGHQYQDASPVTPMCDLFGQRTCGIHPYYVLMGYRMPRDPYYCFRRG